MKTIVTLKKLLGAVLFAATPLAYAQNPVTFGLWPDGAPDGSEDAGIPTLAVYPAPQPSGMAVIACPGGGYQHLAMNHEGHDMAAWFNAQGITCAVLTYRMPAGRSGVPLSDALRAIRLVKEHAAEWGVNPQQVGIMGASAGGHLASTAATRYGSEENRPAFQILLYPVISMDASITHAGSRTNLLGENPSAEELDRYSNERQVTADTPPAFIALSSDDRSVPPANSLRYYEALLAAGVPATMHIYPTGKHGWGFRDSFPYKRQWTGELEKWLRESVCRFSLQICK